MSRHRPPQDPEPAGDRSKATALEALVGELRRSQSRLRAIVESEPECVKVVSADGRLLDINPAGLRMIEAENSADVVDQPVSLFIHPEDREAVSQLHRRALAGTSGQLEFRIIGLKGTERWVETHSTPLRDESGAITAVLSVTRDITERRRAEQQLRQSQALSRMASKLTRLGGWQVAWPEGAVAWSDEVRAIHEVDADFQPTLESMIAFFVPEHRDAIRNAIETCAGDGTPFDLELQITTAKGRRVWVRAVGEAVRESGDATVRIQGAMQDISERKSLEAQLLQSQKMESVGQLAGGIAHDFNNLLTVILGTMDLALPSLGESHPLYADLREVRHAAERASRMVRQLLAFSRRQVLHPEVVNLNAVVGDLLTMLRRLIGENVVVLFRPADDLGNVRADPGQIEQVLVNLAVNARDAMPDGGMLTIETRNVELDELYTDTHPGAQQGPHAALIVSDTGIGMDDATRLRCCEPFFTTKELGKGTGLGLATVYGIVKQSGGSIWVYSELGIGTTFKIYLPRVDQAARPRRARSDRAAGGGSETVLIVEDEAALRHVARRVLRSLGYTVLEATNGGEALQVLDRHDGRVHLMLTDVVMPDMSGYDLALVVRKRYPATRIVFTSGYSPDAVVRHGLLDERAPFLSKPYSVDELGRMVRHALDD